MNRLGFQPDRVLTVWQQLRAMANVGEMTLMSHFAEAEHPDGISGAMARIEQAAEGLECRRSLSNSAATLWHPEAHFDWVRPGIILYGASPSGQWRDIANTGLRPVMTLSSEIIGVQTLKAGERVGYGGRYTARDEQRIGIVAAGYADGYPRHAYRYPCFSGRRAHHDGGDRLDGYASGRFNALPAGGYWYAG